MVRSLSLTQQNTILSLLDSGHSGEAIAKQVDVSPSAVSKLHSKKHSTLPKAIGGHPSKLSSTNIQYQIETIILQCLLKLILQNLKVKVPIHPTIHLDSIANTLPSHATPHHEGTTSKLQSSLYQPFFIFILLFKSNLWSYGGTSPMLDLTCRCVLNYHRGECLSV